jgi:hypothetical protein
VVKAVLDFLDVEHTAEEAETHARDVFDFAR